MSYYFTRLISKGMVAILFAWCSLSTVFAAEASNNALHFDIAVVQGAERYLDLLEYPAYLVVALENNGIKLSNMGSVSLVDEHTVQFKSAMLQYVRKSGSVYIYKSSLEWNLPLKHLEFDVPVEIDMGSVAKGTAHVSVLLPLANLFPNALVDRIRMKIQMLSGEEVQKRMLGYFDDLSGKTDHASGLQSLFSKILLAKIQLQSSSAPVDAGGVNVPNEPGDAESLSDQAYLLATLAIWLIIGPASIALFIIWRARKSRNGAM